MKQPLESQLSRLPKHTLRSKKRWALFLRLLFKRDTAAHRPRYLFPLLAVGTACLVVVIGGGYIYQSPNVQYGQSLHTAKVRVEGRQLARATTPLEKVRSYTTIANRRLAEVEQLFRGSQPLAHRMLGILPVHAAGELVLAATTEDALVQTIAAMHKATEQAIKESEKITEANQAQEALELIAASQDKQLTILRAQDTSLFGSSEKLVDALTRAVYHTDKQLTDIGKVKETIAAGMVSQIDILTSDEWKPKTSEVNVEEKRNSLEYLRTGFANTSVSEERAGEYFRRLENKIDDLERAIDREDTEALDDILFFLEAYTEEAELFFDEAEDEELDELEEWFEDVGEEVMEEAEEILDEVDEMFEEDRDEAFAEGFDALEDAAEEALDFYEEDEYDFDEEDEEEDLFDYLFDDEDEWEYDDDWEDEDDEDEEY